jgi:putative PIN family toxin of toxin-antitoxin system
VSKVADIEGGGVKLVIDTNIVLDLFVYEDSTTTPLRQHLGLPATRWLATTAMRDELARVLAYPQIVKRLQARELPAQAVLDQFDQRTETVDAAPKAPYTCKDPDDQQFIDLAVLHQGVLVSKDAEVLCMAKRVMKLGAVILRVWPQVESGPEGTP